MDKKFVKTKYEKFLNDNFSFSCDQEKVCNFLSKVPNKNLELIIEKSPKILNKLTYSNDKIEAIKIFSNSGYDKIHALSACDKILDELSYDSSKISILKKLGDINIDAAQVYSVSLTKDSIHKKYFDSDKIALLDKIIYAPNAEKAFDLLGYNDEGSDLPFHEVYHDYKKPYYNEYKVLNDNHYQKNSFDPKIQPVIHKHYHVNDNVDQYNSNKDLNSSSIDSESGIGTAEWLGLAGVAAGVAYLFSGLFNSESDSDFENSSNNYSQRNNIEKTANSNQQQTYHSIYPNISGLKGYENNSASSQSTDQFYTSKPQEYYPLDLNDAPPSYDSLFPNLSGFKS